MAAAVLPRANLTRPDHLHWLWLDGRPPLFYSLGLATGRAGYRQQYPGIFFETFLAAACAENLSRRLV